MENKKIIAGSLIVFALICAFFITKNNNSLYKNDEISINSNKQEIDTEQTTKKEEKNISEDNKKVKESKQQIVKGEIQKTNKVRKSDLYDSYSSDSITLSGISELADLSPEIREDVKKIIDNSTAVYMVRRYGGKLLVVSENSDNIRHGIDFVEISIPTRHQIRTTLGYNGKIEDSNNDIWIYDETTPDKKPLKHTKYNKDGDVEFIETWNYDSNNPVKYEMKNAEGKTLSIKKETITDGSDLRIEHLIYDNNGKTKVNVTASYEGSDIKRFTYYNADKLSESSSIYGEYEDGLKVKETVYSSDLKVKNVYKASYKDGIRENITIYDSEDNKTGIIEKL